MAAQVTVTPGKMIRFAKDGDSKWRASGRPSRFANLRSAGSELAVALRPYHDISNTIVLGIVAGGVPVAHEVASGLNQPFDLILRRTLLMPRGPGSAVSAVNVAGSLVLPEELVPRAATHSTPLDYFLSDAISALEQRQRICRRERLARNLNRKKVIIVDCGIRTGFTMQSAIVAVRTRNPAQIIAAVPVGSIDGCDLISTMVDEFVCLAQPEPLGHVGMWYDDFSRPEDNHIHELLHA